jgi:limonene-1,2-epoxide hydrolase
MTTRDVVQGYIDSVKARGEWESFLAEDVEFTNFASPVKRTTGKPASLEVLRRFYSMMKALEIDAILVDGDRACALTRYDLQPPGGDVFESHVAEVFEVAGGKITRFGIYFDSAPYPTPPKPAENRAADA